MIVAYKIIILFFVNCLNFVNFIPWIIIWGNTIQIITTKTYKTIGKLLIFSSYLSRFWFSPGVHTWAIHPELQFVLLQSSLNIHSAPKSPVVYMDGLDEKVDLAKNLDKSKLYKYRK